MNIQKQSGFSLIEVLLAFLILSIGLLGVAGLQTTSVKASHTAMLRTVAITKVQEMAERIRANSSSQMIDYEQLKTSAVLMGTDNDCDGINPVSCAPAALAENDIFTWGHSLINAGLPITGTEAEIIVDNTIVPPLTTIAVHWQERGVAMSYTTTIQ